LFDVGGTIFILHGEVRPGVARLKVNMNRSLYWYGLGLGGQRGIGRAR
jgi:hypothetical protein